MSRGIDSEAVNQLLHREIFDFPEVVRVLLLDNRDEPAGAGRICPAEAGIVLDDIGALGQREMSDSLVSV